MLDTRYEDIIKQILGSATGARRSVTQPTTTPTYRRMSTPPESMDTRYRAPLSPDPGAGRFDLIGGPYNNPAPRIDMPTRAQPALNDPPSRWWGTPPPQNAPWVAPEPYKPIYETQKRYVLVDWDGRGTMKVHDLKTGKLYPDGPGARQLVESGETFENLTNPQPTPMPIVGGGGFGSPQPPQASVDHRYRGAGGAAPAGDDYEATIKQLLGGILTKLMAGRRWA